MTVEVEGPPGYRRIRNGRPARFLIGSLAVLGAEQLLTGAAVAIAYARLSRKRAQPWR